MFVDRTWIARSVAAVEMPTGLTHMDSDFCWCDPVVEVDENGQEAVVHKEVTWN
ncbi:MAG TPA: hypothetical protein VHP35_08910 [Terriglobia bacterium]|jgi:hypothetical protein|nr:hypothetical protein [Terriglobia bacterium]